jgi:hypothetical protein
MTYGEASAFVSEYLRGDHSNPEIMAIHYRMAVMDVSTRCAPDELIAEWTGAETDVFRLLPPEVEDDPVTHYIRTPDIPAQLDHDAKLPVGHGLELAVIFFICSYLTNKSTEKYEAKAERVISIYQSNVLP